MNLLFHCLLVCMDGEKRNTEKDLMYLIFYEFFRLFSKMTTNCVLIIRQHIGLFVCAACTGTNSNNLTLV
jgi:3,4-dihydroxy-2-butanone 4-phosphate synthase